MSYRVDWMAAAADGEAGRELWKRNRRCELNTEDGEEHRGNQKQLELEPESGADWEELLSEAELALRSGSSQEHPEYEQGERLAAVDEEERERRIYRGRTIAMLRRYMRHSMETGRLPSILGREFFRAKVTSYTVVTFEDRVIFVHDMEKCLAKLDGFSQQLIARHILQEHDQAATGRLLNCTERTVRAWVPVALDLLSEILLEVGLMERRR